MSISYADNKWFKQKDTLTPEDKVEDTVESNKIITTQDSSGTNQSPEYFQEHLAVNGKKCRQVL